MKTNFDIFLSIFTRLSNTIFDGNEIIGEILPTANELSELKILDNNECIDNTVSFKNKNVTLDTLTSIDEPIEIKMYSNKLRESFFFQTKEQFIKQFKYSECEYPFYIYEINYRSDDSAVNEFVTNYKTVISLIGLLKTNANYIKNEYDDLELVFLRNKLCVLPVEYDSVDIRNIQSIENFRRELESGIDKETKKEIFISELLNELFKVNESQRFRYLLHNYSSIYQTYIVSFSFYIEKFSFQEVKKQIEKDRIEFTKRIQTTLNEIQTKLIAIPAAILFIGTQLKEHDNGLHNTFLFVGTLVFSILFEILLRNQFGTIKVVNKDIKASKEYYKGLKYSTNQLMIIYRDLDSEYCRQLIYLWIIRVIIWLIPISVFLIQIFITNNSILQERLSATLKCIFNLTFDFNSPTI